MSVELTKTTKDDHDHDTKEPQRQHRLSFYSSNTTTNARRPSRNNKPTVRRRSSTNTTTTLFGRDQELALLQQAYERSRAEGTQQLAFVRGARRTGTSSVALSLQQVLHAEGGCCCYHSMSHTSNCNTNNAVWTAVIQKCLDHLMEAKTDEACLQELCEHVTRHISNDMHLLLPMFTDSLSQLIYTKSRRALLHGSFREISSRRTSELGNFATSTDATTEAEECLGAQAEVQLQQAMAKLLRVLAQQVSLIVVLDDVQFADVASMEFLKVVLAMPHFPILIIMAQQISDRIDLTLSMKPFTATLNDIMVLKSASKFLTLVDLEDFTLSQLEAIFARLWKPFAKEHVASLAYLVFDATEGKVYHVIQYIRILRCQRLLQVDAQLGSTLDLDAIRQKIGTLDRMQATIAQILKNLPQSAQDCLRAASILGDEIDDTAVDHVMQLSSHEYLEVAGKEGLLVYVPQSGGYHFAHDWVRHCAYDLIPENEREQFHLRIGRKLLKQGSPEAMEKNICVVASILNFSGKLITDEAELYQLADLNLRAAKKAVSLNSVADASRFLRKGISYLGSDRWTKYYKLSL
jgi:predicted ATPase